MYFCARIMIRTINRMWKKEKQAGKEEKTNAPNSILKQLLYNQ